MLLYLFQRLLLDCLELNCSLLVHLLYLALVKELLVHFEAERVLEQVTRFRATSVDRRVLRLELLDRRLEELNELFVLHRCQRECESVLT